MGGGGGGLLIVDGGDVEVYGPNSKKGVLRRKIPPDPLQNWFINNL